jgi:ATP-dependent Clp endopeptidase proteolytic subunit ClpP
MSDEKDPNEVRLQELEIEEKSLNLKKIAVEIDQAKANVIETESKAEQLVANTKKLDAEIKGLDLANSKAEADLVKATYEVKHSELDWAKALEKRNKEKAIDDENFLYRFGSDVNSSSVSACIKRLTEWHRVSPESDIEIIWSSPGGSIIDGFELFDYIQHLRNEGHNITTGSLGYAASMAGILLQAGGTRWIGHQAWLMIHRAAFGAYGKTFEVEDEVKFVKRIEERILDIFTSRSKLTRNRIKRNWERKDWWISADEALELGLVDEVRARLKEHKGKGYKGKQK